jgi:hypothetical protein
MKSVGPNKKAALTAIRRFPHFELPIRRLIEADETFREICEELAEAEIALGTVTSMPASLREARQAEWQDLVDRLAGEVEAAIRSDASGRGIRMT